MGNGCWEYSLDIDNSIDNRVRGPSRLSKPEYLGTLNSLFSWFRALGRLCDRLSTFLGEFSPLFWAMSGNSRSNFAPPGCSHTSTTC